MRILFVRSTEGVSGAEIYTTLLAQALIGKKINVDVLTNFWPFYKKMQNAKIHAHFLFMPVPEAGILRDFPSIVLLFPFFIISFLLKIKDIENGKKFDVIILESMTEKLFLSPFLKLLRYKVIWIEHGPLFRTNRSWLVKYLYAYKSKWPNKIIAVSKDTMKDLVYGKVEKRKVEAIYIGVQENKEASRLRGKKKQIIVGFVGGLNDGKGFKDFFSVAKKISFKYPNIVFIILGDGPLLEWAKSEIKKYRLAKKILCLGFVKNPIVYEEKMDILYVPTYLEGLSIAILEAMSMGIVVIARDVGGNRELVLDKKTGFLFNTNEEGEKILQKAVSGKIALRPIKNRAIAHVRKHFNMRSQVSAFLSAFHG